MADGSCLGPGQVRRVVSVDIGGVSAKIERAREGLQSLESDISAFCEFQRKQIIFDWSLPGEYSLGDLSPAPVHYSIRVGEIAYNLRSALDHLIWQMVQANGHQPDFHNGFPIIRHRSKYPYQVESKLAGIDEDRRQLIREFQPFNDNGGVGKHLLMLNTICNFDKHRHLNVVATHTFTNLTEMPLDPIVEVCFMDKELNGISPGYESPIEREGVRRPPVVPVLTACLTAVNFVVGQLTGQAQNLIFQRRL